MSITTADIGKGITPMKMMNMKGSCSISLDDGWSLNITIGNDESVIVIVGPHGEGAAWTAPAGSVRDAVLESLLDSRGPQKDKL